MGQAHLLVTVICGIIVCGECMHNFCAFFDDADLLGVYSVSGRWMKYDLNHWWCCIHRRNYSDRTYLKWSAFRRRCYLHNKRKG